MGHNHLRQTDDISATKYTSLDQYGNLKPQQTPLRISSLFSLWSMNRLIFQQVLQFTEFTWNTEQQTTSDILALLNNHPWGHFWCCMHVRQNNSMFVRNPASILFHYSSGATWNLFLWNERLSPLWLTNRKNNTDSKEVWQYLLASRVVCQCIVTGMQRLPSIDWVQHHLVTNNHLWKASRDNIKPPHQQQNHRCRACGNNTKVQRRHCTKSGYDLETW